MGFYRKYIPEGQEIQAIIHQHWVTVFDSFILWLSFGAVIPSFLYHQSERIRELVPFIALEVLLGIVFIKIIYELFNWYHDVWIITEQAVYDLEWSLFKTKVESIHHENIEGIEVDKHRIWDSILGKGDIIIHKFGQDELAILNANSPYKAVSIIEQFIHPTEEKVDRFDMIMDTLGGVVNKYLKDNGLEEEEKEKLSYTPDKDYTIDARN